MEYAELQTASNFSFLRGASHPEELVNTAKALGYKAVALTDYNTLAGIVRGDLAAIESKMQFIVGARIELRATKEAEDIDKGIVSISPEMSLLVYPINMNGYQKVCRILTRGGMRGDKNTALLHLDDLCDYQEDLAITITPPYFSEDGRSLRNFSQVATQIKDAVKDKALLSIALTINYTNNSAFYIESIKNLSRSLEIPLVAVNDVYYHVPSRRKLQDILTCIRHTCTINEAGLRLFQNAERYLKPPQEMLRLFRHLPHAVRRTLEIAEICKGFSLSRLSYEYPDKITPPGETPFNHLCNLTWRGAIERYQDGIPQNIQKLLKAELNLIRELKYEKYFLTCHDIVRFATERGILCQGRGAAANSAVCYCLKITSVNPAKIDLLFARFVSKERNEPPDIDIDFEHERREEVIQYIYAKYGREHAALTCEVVTYRHRSAVRDVGKALGLSLETVDKLAKSIHRWTNCTIEEEELKAIGIDPDDPVIRNTFRLSEEVLGFPRHLSQHVGGFIICERPLCETVPIVQATMKDRTMIEWDKNDIEVLGILKIDVLGLGMLSCIRKGLELINFHRSKEGLYPIELYSVPQDDPLVYDMICDADTVGVFQIESRAQMSMLPRLKPRCFYDLVIEVAIVRPGPIQGNMVHPYLKCREGIEKAVYPDQRVKDILEKTLGVPLFQEQAMRLAISLAEFTPGEAEKLRRSMASWKRNKDMMAYFQQRIRDGMRKNGYSVEYTENFISQIQGFSEYGFPESHAASFALLVYASAWMKCHYPIEFAAALLNSQPMGFYSPSQIVRDLINPPSSLRKPSTVLPIDVNHSNWDCTVEDCPVENGPVKNTVKNGTVANDGVGNRALRLGTRLVRGLPEKEGLIIAKIIKQRGPFTSLSDFWSCTKYETTRIRKASLHLLAEADAFQSFGLNRHTAHWEIKALPDLPLPLDEYSKLHEPQVSLPEASKQQSMFKDYRSTGLSLRAHPFNFLRAELIKRGVYSAAELKAAGKKIANKKVAVAGVGIIRQRPPTARGVVFITIEDETGIVNLIIRAEVFDKFNKIILSNSYLLAKGTLQRVGAVIYINADYIESLDSKLQSEEYALPSKSHSY